MLLVNRLNNINAQIDSYQEQIAELQRRVTELQVHAQEVQGAESAAESALVQVRTALDMLTAICPDDIITFKSAIDALFAPEPLKLAAYEETEATTMPNPVEPSPPVDNEVVDVDSTPVDEEQPEITNGKGDATDYIPVTDIAPTNGNGNGKTIEIVSEDELKQHKRPVLIRLANNYDIPNYNNKTRDQLAHLLADKVSRDELKRATHTNSLK
ncbi:hypothetical protein [Trichormus variabilis]|uniref:Uncharacterized protein n=1 Tax=Trichormus variabilis SAG 1403-4b TaxID=447716 RepID=A0A433UFD3_ANAVA|nr:hypothetical protein [Trichormus variabilis]RUS92523.1 hypothetical protein DSM107003_50060 [Trichormus variabilis SAG 1403-4b]